MKRSRNSFLLRLMVLGVALCGQATAEEFPQVRGVSSQPLIAASKRLTEALKYVGAPLSEEDQKELNAAYVLQDETDTLVAIQKILDPYCVAAVDINAESRVHVVEGPAKKELIQQGWRTFLVKVHNQAGITPTLVAESPNALPLYMRGRGARQRPQTEQTLVPPGEVEQRWLSLEMFDKPPLKPRLSGLALEYRIVQLYSRDTGRREAELAFHVGQGTQDLGFRNAVPILFQCEPAVEVAFEVRDVDGSPTTAAFVIRDKFGRVYPNPARRLAPDFFFHNQIYRADGEIVSLPAGEYTVTVSRGPEYLTQKKKITISENVASFKTRFDLERWTHAAERGWWSGDHHVHAAGCAHYDSPTEGVTPADMLRHILGEDLNVGCVLSWGPCWYTQKQYFEGRVSALSRPDYLMRYDVEVSGFPSSHAGHLCLLRLSEDDYPDTKTIEQWPSWTLPVLKWGQEQDGVVGYSHSGWGLQLPDVMPDGSRSFVNYRNVPTGWNGSDAKTLPDYSMPRFDGIGANEFIVTVAHDACDFISAVDTPAIWELNIWYHTLNCGFRSKISGETDFPCIYGDKVGLGRIYVKLKPDEKLTFDSWIQGVKEGRSYCGDGLSHVYDMRATVVDDKQSVALGEMSSKGKLSELSLSQPGEVTVECEVTAMLDAEPSAEVEAIRKRRLDQKPYWHLERCRIEGTRKVPVELVVNGEVVATKEIVADGSVHSLKFDVEVEESSWMAVRILPSVHTNPIWVSVDDQPVRCNPRSAEWCRDAVDVCWNSKKGQIRPDEREAAKQAYDQAREIYERIHAEASAK